MWVKRFGILKSAVAIVAAASAITATGFAVHQTAMAGTNGQQITVCWDDDVWTVDVSGPNQDGELVEHLEYYVRDNPHGNQCYPVYDHWWAGDVHIIWTLADYSRKETVCSVPQQQEGSEFTYCFQ
jgi:hypothetical protein